MARVLFINSFYSPFIGGGAEITLQSLSEGLQRRGHDCHVASTVGRNVEASTVENGVHQHRIEIANIYWPFHHDRPSADRRFAWNVLDIYNSEMANSVKLLIGRLLPDAIFCHNLLGFSRSAMRAASETGVRTTSVLHDYYGICPRTTLFRSGRRCSGKCWDCAAFRLGYAETSSRVSAVVGVSRAVLQLHLDAGLYKGVPSHVIYNARALSMSKRSKPKPKVLGFIGSIIPPKGIEWMLRELRRISFRRSVLIAGSGEDAYVRHLKSLADGLDVQFLGRVDSGEFFDRVDVVVVPSIWDDPLPGVAYEALAHGDPVIFSQRGGLPEIVNDGVNGLAVDPQRPDSLGEAITRVFTDESLFSSLQHNASLHVASFTDMERFLNSYEALV